jgi:septal ring factor EnvC (AmiA/AmiB activator)
VFIRKTRYNEKRVIQHKNMKYMPINISRKLAVRFVLCTAVAIVVGASSSLLSFAPHGQAESVEDLRNKSQALQQQIEESNKKAQELAQQADSLKAAIESFDIQIAQANRQIELLSNEIQRLEMELDAAQKELDRQKEMLRASMRALYKRSGASTIEMLASSDSFSEFIDEQEYLERLKVSIQDSANKVVELREQIKAQRDEQKELLEQQQAVKRSLDNARAERSRLLQITEGEEAAYRQQIERLQKKREEVEKELTRKLLAGNFVNLGRVEAGQMVGRVGMTGFTFGPHLHFELRNRNAEPVNPYNGNSLGYGLTWPLPSSNNVTQYYGCGAPYGWYIRKCSDGTSLHAGLDISAPIGTPIVAAKSGTIVHRNDDGDGYGIKVIILHDDGMFTYYTHLNP